MANTGFKGINIKQTGVPIDFAQVILDSSSNAVTTGSTSLEIHEIQSDGTVKVFEWNATGQYTFKTTGSVLTASSAVFAHQKNGLWTYVLSSANAANFTVGAKYFWYITNSSGSPTQICREFQYGSAEGDLAVTASGTSGLGYEQADVTFWKGSTAAAMTGDAYAYLTTNLGALGANATGLATAVWAATTRTLSAFAFSVTASTVSDKTGYALTSTEHTNIATDAQTGLTAQGYTTTRAGYLDTLNGLVAAIWASATRTLSAFGFTVSTNDVTNIAAIKAKTDNLPASPAAVGSQMDLVNAPNATALTAIGTAIWAATTRTLSAFGFSVTASTVSDKTGYALTSTEHTNIATDAQTGMTAQGYTTARAGYLDTLNGLVAAVWSAATRTLSGFSFTVNTNPNSTETAISTAVAAIPTNPMLANATVILAASQPNYAPLLASSYTAAPSVTAIQSGLATSASLTTVANNVTAIKAKTDNLPASPAAVGSQMDLVNSPNTTAVAAFTAGIGSGIATQVWTDATAGDFTVPNSAGAKLVAAGGGSYTVQATVAVPSIVAAASQVPNLLVAVIGDTLSRQFTIGTLTGWSKIIVTAKHTVTDPDSAALFQVEAIAVGGGGLLILNGATASDPTQGSLTVVDAVAGTITLMISKSATNALQPVSGYYSIRVLNGSVSNSPIYNQAFKAVISTNNLIS